MAWAWRTDRRRAAIAVCLALGAAVPGIGASAGGFNLTLERFLVLIALVLTGTVLWGDRGGWRGLGPPHAALAVFWSLNLLFSFEAGVAIPSQLKATAVVVLAATPFLVVPLVLRDPAWLRLTATTLAVVAAAEAFAGLALLAVAYATDVHLPGIASDPLTHAPFARLAHWEPNTLASYAGAAGILLFGLLRAGSMPARNRRGATALTAILLLLVIVNLSRAAWAGTLVGALVVLALSRPGRRTMGTIVGAGGLAVVLLVGAEQLHLAGGVVNRALSLRSVLAGQDGPVSSRGPANAAAIATWRAHPLWGVGPGTRGIRASVTNIELRVLRDTGTIGLLALALAFGLVVARILDRLRAPAEGWAGQRGLLVGSLAAVATLLVAFQGTDGTWLSYPWLFLGLGWAAAITSAPPGAPGSSPPG